MVISDHPSLNHKRDLVYNGIRNTRHATFWNWYAHLMALSIQCKRERVRAKMNNQTNWRDEICHLYYGIIHQASGIQKVQIKGGSEGNVGRRPSAKTSYRAYPVKETTTTQGGTIPHISETTSWSLQTQIVWWATHP